VDDLTRAYQAATPRSGELHQEFRRVLPAGVTRSVAHFDPYPAVLVDGRGCLVHDIDGNEYIDVLNNYTSLVHGHAFAPVTERVRAAMESGVVFPAPHPAQLELARAITDRYPAARQVRFTNSGTEAALLALRIARAATGRSIVVLFDGGYHGSVGELLDRGPHTRRAPYNNVDALGQVVDDSVAAVFVEPFLGSGGVIPADPEFLRELERRCHATGALFVFDEVQALRNAPNGTHALLGLAPDLLLMGKIIGGGFPVGAVGGAAGLLAVLDGELQHSGTFNGNVATMTAGIAALDALDASRIATLNGRAKQLSSELAAAGRATGLDVTVSRAGSIMHVHVPDQQVSALHLALLMEGIYAAPRGMLNLSTALDDNTIDRVGRAYAAAFKRVAHSRTTVATGSDG
jgi:glutamate-1-semialdehyde 2,1-aminomutase